MRARFAIIAGLLAAGASAAEAADLVVKDVPQPSTQETIAVTDWSGFYAGVHAGGAWGRSTTADNNPVAGNLYPGAGDRFTARTSGALGGVQAGYNWQRDAFIFGVEGDLGYLGLKGSGMHDLALQAPVPGTPVVGLPSGCTNPTQPGCTPILIPQPPSQALSTATLQTDGGPYATLRARAGVTSGDFLFFVTGGLFAADLNSHVTSQDGLLATGKTGWGLGWTAGAGVEMAVSEKVRLKFDYLHFDMGSQRVSGAVNGAVHNFDIEQKGDLVRVGLNYRF